MSRKLISSALAIGAMAVQHSLRTDDLCQDAKTAIDAFKTAVLALHSFELSAHPDAHPAAHLEIGNAQPAAFTRPYRPTYLKGDLKDAYNKVWFALEYARTCPAQEAEYKEFAEKNSELINRILNQ